MKNSELNKKNEWEVYLYGFSPKRSKERPPAEQVLWCKEWLLLHGNKRKTFNKKHYVSRIKEYVKTWKVNKGQYGPMIEYIYPGSVVLAALELGFDVQHDWATDFIYINVGLPKMDSKEGYSAGMGNGYLMRKSGRGRRRLR